MPPLFIKLNQGWNAEPNAPDPIVSTLVADVVLRFHLNHFRYADVGVNDVGRLTFSDCARWRLGPTNDEGWFLGQCRYTGIAPGWGDFHEIRGDDPLRDRPDDWHVLRPAPAGDRHYLFYLKDQTFECIAAGWAFAVERNARTFAAPAS